MRIERTWSEPFCSFSGSGLLSRAGSNLGLESGLGIALRGGTW